MGNPKISVIIPIYNVEEYIEDTLNSLLNQTIIKDMEILMIDDGWQSDYGVWEFNSKTFPNPKEMIQELHDLGFKVMLWIVP